MLWSPTLGWAGPLVLLILVVLPVPLELLLGESIGRGGELAEEWLMVELCLVGVMCGLGVLDQGGLKVFRRL